MANKVVVRAGVMEPPLLVTDRAVAVEVCDNDDNLVAVMHKALTNDLWVVTTKADSDWEAAICQLGYGGNASKLNSQGGA